METIERVDLEETKPNRLRNRNRWLTVAVAVLLVALLALGAWLVFGTRGQSPTAAPAEIQQLMEDYIGAWNDHDADAIEALVTPDFTFRPFDDDVEYDMTGVRSY
jgi:cytochrome c-type biogenesis protein CcmH/NrfG